MTCSIAACAEHKDHAGPTECPRRREAESERWMLDASGVLLEGHTAIEMCLTG